MTGKSGTPLVTIVTPTLNQAEFIEATLASVAAQDYERIEHLVLDGGSTDGTLDILRRWGGRWVSEPDRGQADAINKGVRLAAGEIFTWLNSDDVYLAPDVVSLVVERFRLGARIVSGGGAYVDRDGMVTQTIPVDARLMSLEHLRASDTILQPATFYETDLARGCPLDRRLHWAFDWDLFIRLAELAPFEPIDVAIAGYRQQPESKTLTGGPARQRELLRVIHRHHGTRSARFWLMASVVAGRHVAWSLPSPLSRWGTAAVQRVAHRIDVALLGGRGIQD